MSITTKNLTTKQPKVLYNLFLVELWERFGFYIVQALLVLYLTKYYHQTDAQSYDIFSAFSALIYASPVVGGYLADRFLGYRGAVFLGGLLFLIGYCGLASQSQPLFYLSLGALICGNGFFKSCISSLVGALYNENDPRRDGGFTIFYMGINIGSFLGPLLGTWAAQTYGWGYGFGVAALGMIIGMVYACFGFKKLEGKGLPPNKAQLDAKVFLGLSRRHFIWLGVIAAVFLFSICVKHARLSNDIFNIFGALVAVGIVILAFFYKDEQRNKLLAFIILIVFSVLFWALYVQCFTSLTLFTENIVDRRFLSWTIPTAMFQSVNPFFIIVLSPLLAVWWVRSSGTRWDMSTPAKFALAMLMLGIGFLLLRLGIELAAKNGLVAMTWLNLSYLLQTCGELSLSPIGLSMVIGLAPVNLRGMLMGVWFLSSAAGYALGDYLANLTAIPTGITDPIVMGKIYGHAFFQFGIGSIIVGIVLIFCTPFLKRLMHERS